ncbi:MAG: hypothetical protein AB9869_11480 [Verrucomicrobiia bacterium]
MSAPSNSWLDIPPNALWLLSVAALGWIVGPLLGFYFGRRNQVETERRKHRNEFRAALAEQRSKLDMMRFKECEFFEQSVPAITGAVYRVQRFVSKGEWSSLQEQLRTYQRHDKSEFSEGILRTMAFIETGKSQPDRLREHLDAFDRCLK